MPSSTSSSERTKTGPGFPSAVALAVLLVLGVEVALHFVPTRTLLGYGEGLGTYYEVRHTIEEFGAADVVILGESRGRESIVMPLLSSLTQKEIGKPVRMANYACPDARSSEMLLVTRQMMASKTKPRIVLYLVSPRGLLGDERNVQREEVFGVFPDEYGLRSAQKLASLSERPLWEARNLLQQYYYTFRYRYRFRNIMSSLPRGRQMLSPVQGQETTWQRYVPNRSLVTNPISESHLNDYVARLLDAEGNYVLAESKIAALRVIASLCAKSGAELVLVAAPISDDLARHLPPGVLDRFTAIVSDVARTWNLTFVSARDLGLTLDRSDFREQSHLNRQGAEKMTRAIVEQLLVPRLAPSAPDTLAR